MSQSWSQFDYQMMARAIRLAWRGLYTTSPNPRVGCVLVRDGEVIGEGYHIRAGEGHAEVNALAAAGDARGATAYVTLEPCSHHGKTPPCAEALVNAGVSRVIAAMVDPNPQVAGRGMNKLADAGIEISSGLLEAQARELNPGFIKRMESGTPFVRIKLASSLDGRTAMASGESKWITGSAARQDVQRLRARSSAIITGVDSLIHDDSSLTVREPELGLDNAAEIVRTQPLRVVLDSQLRTPLSAAILKQPGRTVIATLDDSGEKADALRQAGAEIVSFGEENGRISLTELLQWLASEQCNEVLFETGATLAGVVMQQQLADQVWLYQAPVFMGSETRPLFDWPIHQMADKCKLEVVDQRQFGPDIRLILQPETGEK